MGLVKGREPWDVRTAAPRKDAGQVVAAGDRVSRRRPGVRARSVREHGIWMRVPDGSTTATNPSKSSATGYGTSEQYLATVLGNTTAVQAVTS